MAIKSNRSICSAWTSAGAFLVSTTAAAFIGISYYGSAASTIITIKDGITTAGRTIAVIPVSSTAGGFVTLDCPIACTSGIVTTNAGTLAGYSVLYAGR